MSEYLKRPTFWLCRRLGISLDDERFQQGRIAMGLELVTVIRTLDSIPSAMLPAETAAVVSVLQTLIEDQGLRSVYGLYDQLSASRRPSFVPEPAHEANVGVGLEGQGHQSSGYASPLEERRGDSSRIGVLRALAEGRRSQGDSSSDETEESLASGDETMQSE